MKYAPSEFLSKEAYLENNLKSRIRSWIRHVARHLKLNDIIHFVFYERLLYDFDNEYSKLLDYLEINLSPEEIRSIKNNVSFKNMQKENPHHVYKGKYGQWTLELSKTQKKLAINIGKPLMNYLNYPLKDDKDFNPSNHLPSLPRTIDPAKLDKIVKISERIRPVDIISIAKRAIKKETSGISNRNQTK